MERITMNTSTSSDRQLSLIQRLSDEQLTLNLQRLNHRKHGLDAELLLYISELDRRKLYRVAACPSLFEYLTSRLGFSEDMAYKRMWAARTLRDFPLVYELLCEGRIHLSALLLIRPHLTAENHRDWLAAAARKSKREVERLVAERCPKRDVPAQVRKLPEPAARQCEPSATPAGIEAPTSATDPTPTVIQLPQSEDHIPRAVATSLTSAAATRAPKIQPLSGSSYRVVFTASERLKQKIRRASELVSHAIPPSDLPALVERALDTLIEREERRRFGAKRPRRQHPSPVVPTTSGDDCEDAGRGIPAAVRREVWECDGGQCTYVDSTGERCQCRHYLQFDHRIARALNGPSNPANIRLRCAAHNALAAEQVLGSDRVAAAVAWAKEKSNSSPRGENRGPAAAADAGPSPLEARCAAQFKTAPDWEGDSCALAPEPSLIPAPLPTYGADADPP
jgi:hypothetical protein